MDNLTHALVGVAMAECALPRQAPAPARRVFMAAGVLAASAPDIDLAYTWIAEAPLGYLLHHRGHSHTLPGLIVLAAIILAACRLRPAARAAIEHGLRRVEVQVKGPGSGRDTAVRSIQQTGIEVTSIKDVTPVPHNGCRQPKRRRG